MILQNLKYIYDFNGKKLALEDVHNITGYVSKNLIRKIYKICSNKESNLESIMKYVNYIILKGYPLNSILFTLNEVVLEDETIKDNIKSKIFYNLSVTEKKLNDGSENHCLVLENFGQGKDKDVLISPSVDLKFRTNIKLNFRISGSTTQSVATAEDLALIQDSLKIYFSKNCGDSWSTSNPISSFNTPKADLITGGPWTIPYRASNNVGWKQMTVNVPTIGDGVTRAGTVIPRIPVLTLHSIVS
jgi:hypothetical protein